MEVLHWLANHLFDLIGTFFGSGFFFFAFSVRDNTKSRRVANLIAINGQNADAWKATLEHPELERICLPKVDLLKTPISSKEETFVTRLVLNLSVAYRAMKCGEFIKLEGLQKDVRNFFVLPIPKVVWKRLKEYQDKDFVAFVERTLGSE